jgi:hypothetical protein
MQVAAEGRELGVELRDVRERPAVGLQAGGSGGAASISALLALPTRRRGSTAKYSRSTTRLITTKIRR